MKEIESYIETYFGIGGNDLSSVGKLFTNTTLKKNDYLLKMSQYAQSIHFVKSGYLRMYAYNESGEKEITQWISNHGMFLTDLSSFMFGTPSRWNIQALSDCELYTISKEAFQSISSFVENWAELEKLFIAKCFVTLENRVFGQLSMTAEEKVKNLMESNPDIFLIIMMHKLFISIFLSFSTITIMAQKEIKTAIDISAPPETVWEILTAFSDYENWNPFITSVEGDFIVGEKVKIIKK